MYDCIIIGMGPAGMSAGIYAARSGLKTILFDEVMPGNNISKIKTINNYLGLPNISGSDLAYKMFEHIEKENIKYKIARVLDIKVLPDKKIVTTTKGVFETKGIIISAGKKYKTSGINNESKFIGKGISYCAICDALLYKDKDICILGNDKSCIDEAKYLSKFAKNVVLLTKLNINESLPENIKIINQKAIDFIGNEYLESVKLDNGEIIECSGVFIYNGTSVDTSFLTSLNITDDNGYIIVNDKMETSIDNIYACGDIIKKDLYQIITACSDGAVAATNLERKLNNK